MGAIRAGAILVFCLGFAVGATVGTPGAADAQQAPSPTISGIVTDTTGVPLKGATVEAWVGERLLGTRITDEEGRFSFPLPDDAATVSVVLRVNRLGYRMSERRIDPGTGEPQTLRLEEEPIAIRGLVVESDRLACRIEDQEDARSLWSAMRRRYLGPMDTVGVATYLGEARALVDRDEIGPLDLPPERKAQRGSSSQLRFSWGRRARTNGYAFPVRRTDMGSSFDSWSYAPLHADFAPHFVDPAFGELHRFRILDHGAFGWVLEFCPDDRERPSIVGSLHLAPDTTLLEAEWLFRTGEPDEDAGGHAVFPPATGPPGENRPLPRESIFWRRLPTGDFQEVHQRYENWIVAQGDTVPFLAPR